MSNDMDWLIKSAHWSDRFFEFVTEHSEIEYDNDIPHQGEPVNKSSEIYKLAERFVSDTADLRREEVPYNAEWFVKDFAGRV